MQSNRRTFCGDYWLKSPHDLFKFTAQVRLGARHLAKLENGHGCIDRTLRASQ